MEQIFLGLVAIVIGALVAVYGVRLFFVLLPLWGFLTGFALAAQGLQALFGDGFLATGLSWAAGLGFGLLLGVLAGVFYWAGVVILAAGVGAMIGSGLMVAIGFEPGILTFGVGLAAAVGLALLAILLDAPTLLVAILTSFGGAAWAVAGAYVLLGIVPREDVSNGALAALRGEPVALVVALAVGAVALGYQMLEARTRNVAMMSAMRTPA